MVDAKRIKKIAAGLGADLCGIAAADSFREAPGGFHPKDIYEDAKSVIVFARRLPSSPLKAKTRVPYTFITEMILNELYRITYALTCRLEDEGMTAIPIPSVPYDYWDAENKVGKGILSLKHAGYLAGLGVFGKNTLLYNNRYGNMITLGAVLTDRELQSDPVANYKVCKDKCTLCIDKCPQKALDGAYVNQKLCREYAEIYNSRGFFIYACSTCKSVCPSKNGVVNR
jgi:epoxyqueuosine reductase QueG